MKDDWCKQLLDKTEEQMEIIANEDINSNNIEYLDKLVDIHKDLENEKYWKEKISTMRYRDGYGNDYGIGYSGRRRDSRGRYMENRGMRYRGDDMIEDMSRDYHEYAEGRDSYGADDGQTLQSLEYMMKSVVEFIAMLQDDAKSQDEVEIIKKYTRKISEM